MKNNAIAKIVEGNWDQLKGKLKKHWGELTDDDLEVIEGSYDTLVGKLKTAYGYTAKEAQDEVKKYIDNLKDEGNDLYATITESLESYKETLGEFEESAVTYVKQNPVKSLSIAVLAGFVVGKLFNLKK